MYHYNYKKIAKYKIIMNSLIKLYSLFFLKVIEIYINDIY